MRDIVILIGLIMLIPMIFKRPYIGALVWTWIAILNPHREAFGFSTALRPNLLIVVVTLLAFIFSAEKKKMPGGALSWTFILFILWTTLTSAISPDPETSFEFYVDFVVKMAMHMVILMIVINSQHRLVSLVWCYALSLGYHAVKIALVTVKSGFVIGRYRGFGPLDTMIDDRNHFAVAMLMLAPILFYLWKHAANRIMRNAAIFGMVCCFLSVIGSFSRGGMLTMAAMLGVLWLRTKNKLVTGTVLAVAAMCAITFAPQEYKDRIGSAVHQFDSADTRFGDDAELDESFCLRIAAWQVGWDMTMDSPVFGNGLRSIQNVDVATPYLRESACNNAEKYKVRAAHNIYVEVLSDSGFPGLGLFLLILLGSIWQCSRIVKATRGKADLLWAHDLAAMIQVSLIGYSIGGMLLSLAYYDGYFILIMMVVVLSRLVRERVNGKEPRRAVNAPAPGRRDRRPKSGGGRRPVRA